MLVVAADDGTQVRAFDEGSGPALLLVHPGLDDGSGWAKVAAELSDRFRVVRLQRRRYRADVHSRPAMSIGREAADVVTLARMLPPPVVLVGHSSGAVVGLEALVSAPEVFAGAVLYEPPSLLEPDEFEPAASQAEAQLRANHLARALRTFLRDVVRVPPVLAQVSSTLVSVLPRFRRLIPGQISDARALNDLGVRLPAYASLDVPVVLLSGPRSPAHLRRRVEALAATLPSARIVDLDGQGHSANLADPGQVARVVAEAAAAFTTSSQ